MGEDMRVLDLFSGIGGFSLGLHRAGMETVAFCEFDEKCRKVLTKHWPDVPQYNDVRTLTAEQLKNDGITDIQIIAGGFPCQDVSNAGSGAGIEGQRSGLWSEFARLISEIRPKYTIIENVTGLFIRGFDTVLCDLAALGYDAEWHCIPALSVGAPHERDRIWIIASDAQCVGQPRQGGYIQSIHSEENSFKEASGLVDAFQRNALPYVCRRHDGIPTKLDSHRLAQLGNSVVPQVVEQIGRAIMEQEL